MEEEDGNAHEEEYSLGLKLAVIGLCEVDPDQRLTCDEVYMWLKPYKEKINNWIKQQLEEYRLKLDELDSKTKKDLVYKLHIQNAFEEKNAVNHVANALQMGRATIFKYLKEWRNEDDK